MGHFGASYTANGGDNNFVKMIVGGVRWVAGEGRKSDCSGTVWSSFTRTVVVPDANNPIGIDVAKDGKIYWSEIGNPISLTSTGYVKMYDPNKPAGNKTTVISIPTRADHGNSEDGVLGFSLQPGFDLSDPAKRNVFVYYSPRNPDWPTSGNVQVVGYNQISRFTLTADGTAAEPNSERVILRVPKAKISGSPSGFPGGPTDSGPGHVGGAGLDFDSAGNLYLGVGDDVSPERVRPQRLHAAGLPLQGALGRPQDVGQHAPTCAARSSASRPSRATSRPTRTRASTPPTRSRPATCSRSAPPRPVPRSTRWASASRSRFTPTRPTPASSAWASTAMTTAPTAPTAPRPASASGT